MFCSSSGGCAESVHQDEVRLAVSYKLCHRVVFTFCFNGAGDAVVLQDRKEKLHEVRGVGGRDDVEHLRGAQPVSGSDYQSDGNSAARPLPQPPPFCFLPTISDIKTPRGQAGKTLFLQVGGAW